MMATPITQGQDDGGQQPDLVLEYVQAWDTKQFGRLDMVLRLADFDEALNAAFLTIHKVFDPMFPYTEQLLKFRETGHEA